MICYLYTSYKCLVAVLYVLGLCTDLSADSSEWPFCGVSIGSSPGLAEAGDWTECKKDYNINKQALFYFLSDVYRPLRDKEKV